MKKIAVHFYKTNRGNEPVREWLKKLSMDDKKEIGLDVKTVEFGWPIGMPVCKKLEKGLYEIRSHLMKGRISRVIFCVKEEKMILLHGFIKKTQKTPIKDLEVSRKRYRSI